MFTKRTKIKNVYDVAIEKINSDAEYDLVIMINVLEHCYDAELVFQNILQITHKNSYFIFEDKFYTAVEANHMVRKSYDAAHPLKVDRKIIENYLYENFEVVYKRIQTNNMFFEGEKIQWDDIYFIGKKNK